MACHTDHTGPRLVHHNRKTFSHALLLPAIQRRCESCHTSPTDAMHRQISGNCAQCHSSKNGNRQSLTIQNCLCWTVTITSAASSATPLTTRANTPATAAMNTSLPRSDQKNTKEGIRDVENCVACHQSADGEPEEKGSCQAKQQDS